MVIEEHNINLQSVGKTTDEVNVYLRQLIRMMFEGKRNLSHVNLTISLG
jgi:hypothetical protein